MISYEGLNNILSEKRMTKCLRHGIIPFIIEDSKKMLYYRGLSEWKSEKGWLTDTCLDSQDAFIRLLNMLDIPY